MSLSGLICSYKEIILSERILHGKSRVCPCQLSTEATLASSSASSSRWNFMKPFVVIGVSGVTCGGKTTLSNKLKATFPDALLIRQDDYFFPEDSDRHVFLDDLHHANWDILSSLDMDRLHEKLKSILSQSPTSSESSKTRIIILDGHLVLNDKRIEELCDKKYYFILPKNECWDRRRKREYDPPDPPGYFDKCVWPMYEMYYQVVQNSVQDIVYLDGMRNIEEIFQEVQRDIELILDQDEASRDSE